MENYWPFYCESENRDNLPKAKVGKLLRREIRDEERRRVSKDKDQATVIPG